MNTVLEAIIIFFCLAGFFCFACVAFGRLLLPETGRGTWVIIWADGAAEELEQRVRSLMWLQSWGLLRCSVLLVDAGLEEAGRAVAARLAGRWPALTLCTRREVERRIRAK